MIDWQGLLWNGGVAGQHRHRPETGGARHPAWELSEEAGSSAFSPAILGSELVGNYFR